MDTLTVLKTHEAVIKIQLEDLKLQTTKFKEMWIRLAPKGNENTLNKEALNNYLASEFSRLEQQPMKICHKGFSIKCIEKEQNKYKRQRTNFIFNFTAYDDCCKTTECSVKYHFNVKDKILKFLNSEHNWRL